MEIVLDLKLDESMESDGNENVKESVEQIVDEDSNSENGTNMEQRKTADRGQSSDSDTECTSPNAEVRWSIYLCLYI